MNGRVLLIDDEVGVCETLHAALSKKGYATTFRTSGQEGFDLLAADCLLYTSPSPRDS